MTTRERIATLYDNGTEPHVIAALLDLAVADVAKTLAEPGFTPPDPSGGGTDNAGRPILPALQVSVNGEGKPGGRAEGILFDVGQGSFGPSAEEEDDPALTLNYGPSLYEAGQIVVSVVLNGNADMTSKLELRLNVGNADCTQRAHLQASALDIDTHAGELWTPAWGGENEHVEGGALALDGERKILHAAEGGVFWVTLLAYLLPSR